MFKNNKPVRVSSINNAHADKLKSDLITAQNKIKELQSVLDMERKNCRDVNNLAVEELQESIKEQGQLQPVLISSDSYLICGFRRYQAISNLKHQTILACRLDKTYKQLETNLLQLQYMENERRQSLDNFEISFIFNELIKQGITQAQICEMFKKDKGFVSKIVVLQNINPSIKQLIKEIEMFGVSQNKLTAFNLKPKKFGVIGVNSLYSIANKDNEIEQNQAFLDMFKKKLTDDEISRFYNPLIPQKERHGYKKTIEKKLVDLGLYVTKSINFPIEKKAKFEQKLNELFEIMKDI